MNTEETQQLSQFLQQLVDVKLHEKDSDANRLIQEAVTHQPDAAYLLVQRCLLQNQALQSAQSQIAELKSRLQQTSAGSAAGGFLHNDPWSAPAKSAGGVPGAENYRIPNPSVSDSVRQAAPTAGAGLGSGFLGNVASTAAGVVAGSFLFQGIENLMGHHQSASGWGQQAFGGQQPEQTVINNYYGDSGEQPADTGDDYLAGDDSGDYFDDGDSDWV
ncbi:DUF2076 domain-containing protein [Methylomonas methanica]|uniref:Putative periplasmic ligand-binding sensor protein n=1 Tax=Methylomonas methanica (strain DSM 25384 / MC09) TaxID=857087 RepID=G0A5Y0_METMM|nr:DUF2076 family protein [Methylomonas methanica]AEF99257.1 putative periplasmic ligand-binding sensor protein [Methylomonas methanica MC09]